MTGDEVEAMEARTLEQMERELLPNEYRGLPRLPAPRRRRRLLPITAAVWEAFGVDWTEDHQ